MKLLDKQCQATLIPPVCRDVQCDARPIMVDASTQFSEDECEQAAAKSQQATVKSQQASVSKEPDNVQLDESFDVEDNISGKCCSP